MKIRIKTLLQRNRLCARSTYPCHSWNKPNKQTSNSYIIVISPYAYENRWYNFGYLEHRHFWDCDSEWMNECMHVWMNEGVPSCIIWQKCALQSLKKHVGKNPLMQILVHHDKGWMWNTRFVIHFQFHSIWILFPSYPCLLYVRGRHILGTDRRTRRQDRRRNHQSTITTTPVGPRNKGHRTGHWRHKIRLHHNQLHMGQGTMVLRD